MFRRGMDPTFFFKYGPRSYQNTRIRNPTFKGGLNLRPLSGVKIKFIFYYKVDLFEILFKQKYQT